MTVVRLYRVNSRQLSILKMTQINTYPAIKKLDDVVLVGAGGHAKACIEIFELRSTKVAFCIGLSQDPQTCLGIPVVRNLDAVLRSMPPRSRVFVAVGNNKRRIELAEFLTAEKFIFPSAISQYAFVSPSAKLGIGVVVAPNAVIGANAEIQDFAIVNSGAIVEHDCVVGRGAHIGPAAALAGGTKVGKCSLIGIGARVIPRCSISDYAIVGAGAVVTNDLADPIVYCGTPAKPLYPSAQRDYFGSI